MKGWVERFKVEIWVFVLLLGTAGQVIQPVEYDNVMSRYLVLSAVVNDGTWAIDKYADWTIDISTYAGHTYTNKSMGSTVVGLPVYWALRRLTPLGERAAFTIWELYLLRLITTTLLFALSGAVLCWLGRTWTGSVRRGWWAAMMYGLGSMALVHGVSFTGHMISCSMLVFGIALLHGLKQRSGQNVSGLTMGLAATAGLCFGLAAITEYLAMAIAGIMTLYVVSLRPWWRVVGCFVAGGAVCALALAAYNWACFGSPVTTPYSVLDDEFFRESTSRGLMGIGLPKGQALIGLLVTPGRALAVMSPFLVLAIPGAWQMWKLPEWRREAVAGTAVCVSFALMVSGYFGWHGGYGIGPRYLLVVVPFLCLATVWVRWRPQHLWIPGAMGGWSMVQMVLAVVGIGLVPNYVVNPLVEVTLPLMVSHGVGAVTIWHLLVGSSAGWYWGVVLVSLVGLGLMAWRTMQQAHGKSTGDVQGVFLSTWGIGLVVGWLVLSVGLVTFMRTSDPIRVPTARIVLLDKIHEQLSQGKYAVGLERGLDVQDIVRARAEERMDAATHLPKP